MSELNLIPYDIRDNRLKRRKVSLYIFSSAAALTLLVAIAFLPKVYVNILKERELQLSLQASTSRTIQQENAALSAELKNLETHIKNVETISFSRTLVTQRLRDIQAQMPYNVKLNKIEYIKKGITLNGFSENYNAISEFASNLQSSNKYKEAKIFEITRSGDKVFTFIIKVVY